MSIRSLGWIVLCAGLAIIAAQPVAKWLIRGELERVTGARLSASCFQVHPYTGRIFLQQAEFTPSKERWTASLGRSQKFSPITIDNIWLQGDVCSTLYRRFTSPLAIMDGVSIRVSEEELQEVPTLERASVAIVPSNLVSNQQTSDELRLLEMLFEEQSKVILGQNQTVAGLDLRLSEMEGLLHRADNPLRNLAIAEQTQDALKQLAESLASLQDDAELARSTFLDSSSKIATSHRQSLSVPTSLHIASVMSEAETERIAEQMVEQVLADTWESLRPKLGLAVRFLSEMNFDSLEGTTLDRGSNYLFAANPKPCLHIERLQMNGRAHVLRSEIPFHANLVQVGGLGLGNEDVPTLQLEFPPSDAHQTHVQQTAFRSVLTPDRQGFLVRGTSQNLGRRVIHAALGDFQCEVSTAQGRTAFEWIVHHQEWKLDLELSSRSSEVALTKVSSGILPSPSLKSSFVIAPTATEKEVVMKARYEGTLSSQGFLIVTKQVHRESTDALSKSIGDEIQALTTKEAEIHHRQTQELLTERIAKQQAQLKQQEDTMQSQLAKLTRRLKKCQVDIAAMQSPRSDLRFSRQPSQSTAR